MSVERDATPRVRRQEMITDKAIGRPGSTYLDKIEQGQFPTNERIRDTVCNASQRDKERRRPIQTRPAGLRAQVTGRALSLLTDIIGSSIARDRQNKVGDDDDDVSLWVLTALLRPNPTEFGRGCSCGLIDCIFPDPARYIFRSDLTKHGNGGLQCENDWAAAYRTSMGLLHPTLSADGQP
ncbi:hypothetical protein V494_01119 [Pseudogymnoascus sp. VKM F-4513 (FW-928)]|nr:hypothetical protein V494_01119 [Pseudogymnoascus sp. VKM F-4513 (FW-928)]